MAYGEIMVDVMRNLAMMRSDISAVTSCVVITRVAPWSVVEIRAMTAVVQTMELDMK